ncbi:MAG: patatin family protein [Bacilli bacterium]|nr:patatin family protein [Bacilli bacterium]
MTRVGLVLEGGAMRGLYTAGVLDVLMEENVLVDGIIGVSAGALFGLNYFSNQKGRALRYNKKYSKDLRFISVLSLLLTGNLVNKSFAYYKVTKKLDPFDNDTYLKNNKDFYAVITNVKTGNPEYVKINDVYQDLEVIRATSAMPLASRMIKINNELYLDGGITDSIPIAKMQEMHYDKIIVVLTQPKDYRKEKLSLKKENIIKRKFKKYPLLIDAMFKRPEKYNETIKKIIAMENKKEIFVIRPSKKLVINIFDRNKEKMQEIYNVGVNDTKKILKDLKKYLEK